MKILIAYDGSNSSISALEDLQRAGLPQDAEAEILSVAEVFPHLSGDFFGRVRQEPACINYQEFMS